MDRPRNGVEVALPWGAWYEDTSHVATIPAGRHVDVLEPADLPALDASAIEAALDAPIESPPLGELAGGCRSACIAVDDLARPTRAADVLPMLLDQLRHGGMDASRITVVMATGTHGAPADEQIAWKIGERAAATCRVTVHDANAPLAKTGISYGKEELRINRDFLEADLKIVVGCVLPHSFAGFSGGAKLLLPGLTDVQATARSHKFVQMGLRGGQDPNENRFRLEIERLARQLGLNYAVSIVPNRRRESAAVAAGDVVASHRHACGLAAKAFATPVRHTYDCVVLNAFPKDTDLIQSHNALIALKTAKTPLVRDGGLLVIATAASEGVGRHGLFAPGGASYREPRPLRGMGSRDMWLYAPRVNEPEFRQIYWEGYRLFRNPAELTKALDERLPAGARVAVLPTAPMQQIDDQRDEAG